MPVRKTQKISRKASKTQAIKKRVVKKPSLSVLVLECDANRLARESVAMAHELGNVVRTLSANAASEIALINSQDDLRDTFASYSEKYGSIKVIVVIGHSNRSEIRISTPENTNLEWQALARWFAPFSPQSIVFIACEAGQYPSKEAFFREIPKLHAMFASPVKLWKTQVDIIKALVPYLISTRTIDPDTIALGQLFAFLKDRTIMLYCKRRDTLGNEWIQFLSMFT